MAQIPVERKAGLPWWIWPLALLALLAFLWAIWGRNRDVAVATPAITPTPGIAQATATVATGTVSGSTLNDLVIFTGASDKTGYIGRSAQFSNVRVQRVLSDRTFTVGPARGQEMFAMLDESLDTAGGKEQIIKVKEGQSLNLSGLVERAPDAEVMKERKRGLSASEATELKNHQAYLLVKNISLAH